jgi:glycosyltransferase involved in cell wall biosynthesis
MKILFTVDPEIPVPPKLYGGIERIVDALAREMQILGHEVAMVAHRDSTVPAKRLYPWPGMRSQDRRDTWSNTMALWRATREFKPDVVHSFARLAYLWPMLVFSHFPPRGPKFVMSYQRKPTVRTVKMAAALGGKSLVFTGCSEHICGQGRLGGGHWQAIPNFVELRKYTFRPAVSEDAPLVFLSRVERVKGAHMAIAVARRTGRRLVIAGNHGNSGEDGRYWDEKILPQLGKNGVEYVGPVDDAQKNQLLGRAAAMIVPVEWDEPFGIVFAESLACGTPVISCPRGALPEIVRGGVDGFLVNDLDQACAAVAELPAISRTECRRRVEMQFSSGAVVAKYLDLYGQIANPKTAS